MAAVFSLPLLSSIPNRTPVSLIHHTDSRVCDAGWVPVTCTK
jgi:hypothetical protein